MPLGKAANAARMRAYRASKRAGGTILLSRSEVRRLHKLGVSPAGFLRGARVSLDEYRDLQRQLEAKVLRVQWQSGGIKMLQEENATLRATIETIKATDAGELALQRVVQLEATRALEEVQRATE